MKSSYKIYMCMISDDIVYVKPQKFCAYHLTCDTPFYNVDLSRVNIISSKTSTMQKLIQVNNLNLIPSIFYILSIAAEKYPKVQINFNKKLVDADLDKGKMKFLKWVSIVTEQASVFIPLNYISCF